MKTKEKHIDKSAIEELRSIRDTISKEIQDLSFDELKKYLEKKATLHSSATLQKMTRGS